LKRLCRADDPEKPVKKNGGFSGRFPALKLPVPLWRAAMGILFYLMEKYGYQIILLNGILSKNFYTIRGSLLHIHRYD